MIERFRVQNFRCLRDVSLRLGPLTALVGPNASGKSALLDALACSKIQGRDVWRRCSSEIRLGVPGGWGQQLPIPSQETVVAIQRPYTALKVRLDPDRCRTRKEASEVVSLDTNGSNLTNLLASLPRRTQASVADALGALVPPVADVDVRPTRQAGKLELRFQDRWDPKVWYRPAEVSDGTMLVLAYLTLQHLDPPVDLLAIEEPERGLHPYLMGQVITLLRDIAHGRVGPRPMQIVLATHSAELLEHLEPGEVRFLDRREEDGATIVRDAPTGEPDWARTFHEYQESLGSAWLAGGLGGVP